MKKRRRKGKVYSPTGTIRIRDTTGSLPSKEETSHLLLYSSKDWMTAETEVGME
jgi:hypothetical protein